MLASLKPFESVAVPAMTHGIEQRIETSHVIKKKKSTSTFGAPPGYEALFSLHR